MNKKSFPKPLEVKVPPELEGWEEMYPPHYLFSKDREDWEDKHLWYRDNIHAPDPMYPFDLIFQEAWQIALSQYNTRVFCIPPAQGVQHRILGCYLYISPVAPPPEDVVKEKAELFQKRVPYVFEHFDELFDKWLKKFKDLGKKLEEIQIPKELPKYEPDELIFPAPRGYYTSFEVIDAYDRMINYTLLAWQYHFEYLNLSYLAYLTFVDTCKKLFPTITESVIGKMVAGEEASMFKPEEELCALARLAAKYPKVKEILKEDIPPEERLKKLETFDEGKEWLKRFEEAKDPWFFVSCGSGWFHYEGSWINQLSVPFAYLKDNIERLEKGEVIERDINKIREERDRIVNEYRKLISNEEDRQTFDDAYKTCRTLYKFSEGHLFWVEHWFHTILFDKMWKLADLLVKYNMLEDRDDLFLFNRFEIPVLLEDFVTAYALGEGVPARDKYWKEKAAKRRRIIEAAKNWAAPPALGPVPEEIAEPFTVMLWGVTGEKLNEWLKGEVPEGEEINEIKGFAASAGVVEGKARVVKLLKEIETLQEGEILVAPTTNPSWAPVFTKIKAAVTDIGGLTSHAAIVCREYGLPAVTGTGIATRVIKTGDIIRVDGGTGVVTVVKRAGE